MLGCKVDFCENNKCKYGQCKLRKKKGGYRCKCKRGYLGKYCDKGQYLVIIYVYVMKMKFNFMIGFRNIKIQLFFIYIDFLEVICKEWFKRYRDYL